MKPFRTRLLSVRAIRSASIGIAAAAALALLIGAHPTRAQQAQAGTPQGRPGGRGGVAPPPALSFEDHDGWLSMFDGQTLNGWDGNPQVWKVENGAITAESTAERRVGSTHLIWRGGEPADFEWKLEMKLDGDIHSGIAYRSVIDLTRTAVGGSARVAQPGAAPRAGGPGRASPPAVPPDPKWTLYGIGFDNDADPQNAGNIEERGSPRRWIAPRGWVILAEPDKPPRSIGSLGDPDALKAFVKVGDWNQIHIIARGHQLTHIMNGHVMAVLIDDDPMYFRPSGLMGLQIEQFGTGKVNFRNIWINRL